MKTLLGLALAALFGLGAPAFAQSAGTPVVVELYTSQGCSSCPPADRVLADLAARDDVVALALHVDYWDYMGWKDRFASPAFSDRQRAYARHAGARTVYTPQMIVGGADHLIGTHVAELQALIRAHAARPPAVDLALERRGAKLRLRAAPRQALPEGTFVQFVRYDPLRRVSIERGENAGRVIDYANIVTEWRRLREWNGPEELVLDLDAPGPQPVVVIVQEPGPGRILGVAHLR
ncbi:DUF1223 domain-containing protein [Albidovulum sp.]